MGILEPTAQVAIFFGLFFYFGQFGRHRWVATLGCLFCRSKKRFAHARTPTGKVFEMTTILTAFFRPCFCLWFCPLLSDESGWLGVLWTNQETQKVHARPVPSNRRGGYLRVLFFDHCSCRYCMKSGVIFTFVKKTNRRFRNTENREASLTNLEERSWKRCNLAVVEDRGHRCRWFCNRPRGLLRPRVL